MNRSRRMPDLCRFVALCAAALNNASVHADVTPVAIHAPEQSAWVGQRTPFFVELRSKGPFVGAANFSLPQIPRCVLVKVGNPVVSSQEIDGDSWFIQTHEFALFSQAAGAIEIPSFEVRFRGRDGIQDPIKEHIEQSPALKFDIKRPPDSGDIGFLVTTDKFEISQTWEPQPGPCEQGAVFRRTITQTADQMTGMALSPPPTNAPAGIRIYPESPEVTDKTERGDFSGTRRDTITYFMQQSGTLKVPAIKYIWWNPKTQEYGSKTLPAETFEVSAASVGVSSDATVEQSQPWGVWLILIAAICGMVIWQHDQIYKSLRYVMRRLNPPSRVASRKLLRACRHHDARAAETAWQEWEIRQPPTFHPSPSLNTPLVELQRHLYGPQSSPLWRGDQLEQAFRQHLANQSCNQACRPSDLPVLNPVTVPRKTK